jgi:hypothetical protein
MRKYGHDYKLIWSGDASMSPYELEQPGGSVEHWNDEPGATGWSGCCAPGRTPRGSIPSRGALGLDHLDPERPQHHGRAHVPRDDLRARARDEVAYIDRPRTPARSAARRTAPSSRAFLANASR